MAQPKVDASKFSPIDQEDEIQRRKFRWYYFATLIVWTFISLSVPVILFFFTRNMISFSLFSTLAPPIYLWYQVTKYLFPMDEKTFKLKKMRRQNKGEKNKQSP